jgi:hypothetical protein
MIAGADAIGRELAAGTQTDKGTRALCQVDVSDQRTSGHLFPFVEKIQSVLQTRSGILAAQTYFDLRIVAGELCTDVTNVDQVDFTNALRQASRAPFATQLEIFPYALGVLGSGLGAIFFVPAPNEKIGHAVSRFHFTERYSVFINPEKVPGRRPYNRDRHAFDNAHSQAVGQDARDDRAAHSGQTFQLSTDTSQVGAPNARSRRSASCQRSNLIGRRSRRAGNVNAFHLKQRSRGCDAIANDEGNQYEYDRDESQSRRNISQQRAKWVALILSADRGLTPNRALRKFSL